MSILKVDAIRHNSATSDAITTHSDGTASAKIVDVAGGPLSNRNLIINGAMNVAQRSPNVAVNIPGGKTVTDVDRFGQWTKTADGNWKSGQQVSDAPADFQFSRKITSLAANTIEAGTYHTVRYAVEGYDAAQLNCGLSSAKTVTLSFYVKSSLTGTFGLNFTNGANNRSYPTTYTISNPNVWERKTITVTLDTSGTWLKTNGVGLEINWQLAIGSSYSTSTLNQWQGNWRFPSSATDILATNGATWQLTGVQLEVGNIATSFEHRSFVDELRRCQRYYEKSYPYTIVPGAASYYSSSFTRRDGTASSVVRYYDVNYKVTKRASPDITIYNPQTGATGSCRLDSGTYSAAPSSPEDSRMMIYSNTGSPPSHYGIFFHYTLDAEM